MRKSVISRIRPVVEDMVAAERIELKHLLGSNERRRIRIELCVLRLTILETVQVLIRAR